MIRAGLIENSDPSLKAQTERQRIAMFNRRLARVFHSACFIRSREFWQYVPVNQHLNSGPQAENEHIRFAAHFTAKYLPLLIDRLIHLPPQSGDIVAKDHPLENIYHITFKFTDPNYIGKFMVSDRPIAAGARLFILCSTCLSLSYLCLLGGREIASVMAQRLIDVASTLEGLERQHVPSSELQKYGLGISRTLTTLTLLIIARKQNPISATTCATLIRTLNKWSTRTPWDPQPNNFDMTSSSSLKAFLSTDDIGLQAIMKQRRRSLKGRDQCALPSCQNDQGLKTCQRSNFFYSEFDLKTD